MRKQWEVLGHSWDEMGKATAELEFPLEQRWERMGPRQVPLHLESATLLEWSYQSRMWRPRPEPLRDKVLAPMERGLQLGMVLALRALESPLDKASVPRALESQRDKVLVPRVLE